LQTVIDEHDDSPFELGWGVAGAIRPLATLQLGLFLACNRR
jgi:hypothetical protein